MSQKKLASRPSLGSTAAREFTIAKREEEKKALELEKDSVKSINDVKDKLRVQEYINSPSMKNASIKIEISQVVFYELDVRDIKPSVKYCVIIYEDMTYRIWYYDIMISPETVSDFVKCSKIQYFSDITYTLQYIQKIDTNSESPPINDQVNACIEKLEKLEHLVDQDILPKLVLIIEQLKLAFMNTYHRLICL